MEKKIFLMQGCNNTHLQCFTVLSFIPKASSCVILNASHIPSGMAQCPHDFNLIGYLSNSYPPIFFLLLTS